MARSRARVERPARNGKGRRLAAVRGSFECVEALDAELARLARGVGALRLSFGLVLEALAQRHGHHELGFSSLEAYGLEHCQRSARWIQQTRSMGRRLGELPAIRSAVLSGALTWSMAVLLSRVATAENEKAWLLFARDRTVRQVKEVIRSLREGVEWESQMSAGESGPSGGAGQTPAGKFGAGGVMGQMSAAEPGTREVAGQMSAGKPGERAEKGLLQIANDWRLEEPEPMHTLTITVAQPDAWLFECARLVIGRVGGSSAPDAVIEALLAEGESSMFAWLPEEMPRALGGDPVAATQRQWEAQLERWRREAEELCEPRISGAGVPELEALEVPAVEDLALESTEELDRRLRDVADELARRDVEIGRLAERFWQADGWRRLGYATARQYASERLGMSLSSVKDKRQLVRRLEALPEVARAVESGEVGYEGARLVTRVATEFTSRAWVERARERTAKHLQAEVAAAELLGRVSDRGAAVPPTVEQMEAVEVLAAQVVSGAVFTHDDGIAEAFGGMLAALSRSRRGTARVTLRLRVREGTYWHYKARERLHRRYGPSGSFLRFLCASLIDTWKDSLESGVAYEHVYARDRFECASPVCSRRDITPHHLRYRSHGGDDSLENVVSLCVWCHLQGIHEGRLKAKPPASDARWEIGRRGHTVVHGRRRVRNPEGVRLAA